MRRVRRLRQRVVDAVTRDPLVAAVAASAVSVPAAPIARAARVMSSAACTKLCAVVNSEVALVPHGELLALFAERPAVEAAAEPYVEHPTEPLPPEYPDPLAFFTVTFFYNEQPPG